MEEFQSVLDVLTKAPRELLTISYGAKELNPGSELTPTQVQEQPKVKWNAEAGAYYTLLFVDPDVPPAFNFRQFTHWLVADIPGADLASGTTVYDYLGSGPPEGSGLHRYVFILYKQPAKLGPSVTGKIKDDKLRDRGLFSSSAFVVDNKLEGPIAANFYRAQYDDFVPQLRAKLIERYGQEEGVAGQEGEVKLTPFNMKEELEEGHFDVEGNYHWDKEKVIKDNWLDNIDWVKLKDGKEGEVKDTTEEDMRPDSPFDDRSAYRQVLSFMEPGETVAKSLRRLGGGASLSASERLKRRKQGLSVDSSGDAAKVTELTALADRILTKTGNMDVYQESYAYIKNLTEQSSSKESQADALDMYADDFDEKEKERKTKPEDGPASSDKIDQKEPPLMWEYTEMKGSDDIKGPFTSEEMQVTANKLNVEFWVRKVGTDGDFYSSKRVDFELYT